MLSRPVFSGVVFPLPVEFLPVTATPVSESVRLLPEAGKTIGAIETGSFSRSSVGPVVNALRSAEGFSSSSRRFFPVETTATSLVPSWSKSSIAMPTGPLPTLYSMGPRNPPPVLPG